MAGCSIVLCDMDQVYIRKLAAGLKRFFDVNVLIQMCSCLEELAAEDTDITSERIILCGQTREKSLESQVCPEEKMERRVLSKEDIKISEKWHFIRLKGSMTEEDEVDIRWEDEIYKYQPVSQIAAGLQQYVPAWNRKDKKTGSKNAQKWYGVFSVCRHESAIPFVCSMAKSMGEHQKVLVVLLTQFCGLPGLLGIECGCDTESFFLRLRQGVQTEISQVALPKFVSLPGFELMTAPQNPQVLYEMEQQDMQALIARLEHSQYDNVIWMAESVLPGIAYLFERSRRLFLIEKTDTYSMCCQREFEEFCQKIPEVEWDDKIRHVCLPVYGQMECGEHLLWQWSQSAVGSTAEKYVEEEMPDGG